MRVVLQSTEQKSGAPAFILPASIVFEMLNAHLSKLIERQKEAQEAVASIKLKDGEHYSMAVLKQQFKLHKDAEEEMKLMDELNTWLNGQM